MLKREARGFDKKLQAIAKAVEDDTVVGLPEGLGHNDALVDTTVSVRGDFPLRVEDLSGLDAREDEPGSLFDAYPKENVPHAA